MRRAPQRAADNRRADHLRDLGWDIRRFTYEEVMRDGPDRRPRRHGGPCSRRAFGDNPRP